MGFLFVALLVVGVHHAVALNTIVQTDTGIVEGKQSDLGYFWKGIPYATPPVGPLRWQQTTIIQPWEGVKNAQNFGPGCPQLCTLPPGTCPETTSEDCLTLNIYAPSNASLLPVMVFIHGGRFEQGGSGVGLYDGSFMANQTNVVVVTLNYRLGVLGFLVVDGIEGQFGVLDQRVALRWIQQNILQFGGDANRVTLFGQSAGASSIEFHLLSEESFGLYHQVIIESGPFALPFLDLKTATQKGDYFSDVAGCSNSSLNCLRNLSIDDVLAAQKKAQGHIFIAHLTAMFMPWTPIIDGTQLLDEPVSMFSRGQFNQVPIILGTVAEEGLMFVWELATKPLFDIECDAIVDVVFTYSANKILNEYPIPKSPDCRMNLSVIATDYIFECCDRNILDNMAKVSSSPVYRYWFNHSYEEIGGWGPNYTFCEHHVCHGEELPFVFGTAEYFNISFSADEIVLQNTMISYWGTFAHNANPNSQNQPYWAPYELSTDLVMKLETPASSTVVDVRASYCAFWDTLGYSFQ